MKTLVLGLNPTFKNVPSGGHVDVGPWTVYTVSWNKDQVGAGHICGTSLYIASSLYLAKICFFIIDAYFDGRP